MAEPVTIQVSDLRNERMAFIEICLETRDINNRVCDAWSDAINQRIAVIRNDVQMIEYYVNETFEMYTPAMNSTPSQRF